MTKVLLIGLDAACFDYLDPWFAAGELPHLAQLMGKAARGVLRSTVPPVTSVAWTSMVTGLEPGRFGLYDVIARRGHDYEFIAATFLNTHQRALWNVLSQRGRRVAVIGVPSTYPASPVSGIMLTGFVRFDPRLQSTYSNIDWSRARVYAPSSHGPLYLNVRGREPQGIVEPGAPYERLRDEVIAAFLEAQDPNTGRELFAWVRRGEEVYQGPYAAPPPDLVFEPADWRYKVVTGFHSHPLVRPNRHRRVGYVEHGWHTPWGIVALSGPGVRPGALKEANIADIAPTVLYLLDEPIPDDLDGKVLRTAFTSEWQSTHGVIKRPFVSTAGQQGILEEGEIAIVEDRLRGLGYLG